MNPPIEAIETVPQRGNEKPLSSYLDVLISSRWSIFMFIVIFAVFGAVYLLASQPVYRADIAVQIEEQSPTATKGILGDVSSLFDVKPATSGEMEVIRSRSIVEPAVDHFNLYVQTRPHYFPLVGEWFSKHTDLFQMPESLRFGGFAWANESIDVARLDVPDELIGKPMEITALAGNHYTLSVPLIKKTYTGTVGEDEHFAAPGGNIDVHINNIIGPVGSRFDARRFSRLAQTEALQARMGVFERGRESGVIGVTLEGTDPVMAARILNQIGQEYVRQNIERKTAQAGQSLAFLNTQLPEVKKRLDASEQRYNNLRNSRGTIDLGEESKQILQQSTDLQKTLFELQTRRAELATRFSGSHPSIIAIDRQIGGLQSQLASLTSRIKKVPDLEQDVVRLQRDVTVNSELYTTLLNNAQQLGLIKAGKVGTVRMVDSAAIPEEPVRPKPLMVMSIALLLGAIAGVVAAFVRNALFGGLTDPDEVERFTGLPVLATIPYSDEQERLWKKSRRRNATTGALLASSNSNTPSIESLRGFRSVLSVSMRQAHNNIVVFTGPVAGVGKSFLSANFAFIQAAIGKRVLLIDADFRKGQLNKYYGTGRENGLFEVLAGTVPLAEVRKRNIANGVDFISTGNVTFDPSELLAAPAFGDCLAHLSAQYDIVIIDTAPVLASSDAAVVGTHAAAVLVVVRSGVNTVGEIHETEKRLVQAGAPVSGVLFNGLKLSFNKFNYRSKYGRYRYTRSDYYSNYN
jgi:tyrosine-protein kinase Etk/Wzc